jgi:exosome complex RNA-binding protein Rrp4
MIVYFEVWKNDNKLTNLLDYDGKEFIPSIDDIIVGNYEVSITNEKVFVHGKVFERLVNHNSIVIRINQF